MAEDAFLHKEFVAPTACPVGCLKSSEKTGDKENKSENHCGSGAAASRLKAKDFRELRLFLGFPQAVLEGKNPPANDRDLGSIPGWEDSPREGCVDPLQCSCQENPMDRATGGLQSMGSQSWTRLK